MDITFHTILFFITQVVGSVGTCFASHTHVDYVVFCRDGVLYN